MPLTSFLMICAATSFAVWLVVAQKSLVTNVMRRFVSLSRFEQALLVVAVCVTTVCAQKSGVEKVEVEGGGGERANVFNAEKGESQRRGEVADQNGRAESMTPPDEDDDISSVGRVIDATLPLTNLSSETSNDSVLRVRNTGLISAQIEFFANGDFITRSNDVERVYRRVNPDDWDDDGLANEIDDDPLVAADSPQFGLYQTLPDGANESAYYWVDLVVPQTNATFVFNAEISEFGRRGV